MFKMANQRRDARLWILGIILGIVGNMLVSACVEIANTTGFKQMAWTLVLTLSWIVMMRTLSDSARMLNVPTRRITTVTFLFLAFIVIWALVVYFVLPIFT
jgi:hypothetical protein